MSDQTELHQSAPNVRPERPKQPTRSLNSRIGPASAGLFMFMVVYKMVQEDGSGATAIGSVIAMILIWRAFSGLRTS